MLDKKSAVQSLVEPLRTPFPESFNPTSDGETAEEPSPNAHLLTLSHCVRTYKTILSGGHFDATTKTVKVLDESLPPLMSSSLLEAISSEEAGGSENVVRIACAAPFVLVELLAALDGKGSKQVKSILGSAGAKERIGGSEAKGAGLLLERIEAL